LTISEAHAVDAACGVAEVEPYPRSPVAYFRASLVDHIGRAELARLLKTVRLPRNYAKPPEDNGQWDPVAQVAAKFRAQGHGPLPREFEDE
jgi:hypothetical protein